MPVSSPETPVVLLHGQPSTHVTWLPVHRLLGRLELFSPDRPGYGSNPAPATDYPGNVQWLMKLLDDAGLERALLVGHSWAGGIATLAAARHPDRVAGLLLVSSVGPGCLLPQDYPLSWPGVGDALAYVGLRAARSLVRRQAHRGLDRKVAAGDLAEVDESLRVQFDRPVWRSFVTEQRWLLRQLPMLEKTLPLIHTPTIVLAGTSDAVIPPDSYRKLCSRIAGSQLRLIPGVGHMLPLDVPDAVAHAIMDLLAYDTAGHAL